nr:hypothetical protein [Candidatus Sigynarchaeota archaeon]
MDPVFLKKVCEMEDVEQFENIVMKMGHLKTVEDLIEHLESSSERKCLFLGEKLDILKVKRDLMKKREYKA